jgi:hypothetical protein
MSEDLPGHTSCSAEGSAIHGNWLLWKRVTMSKPEPEVHKHPVGTLAIVGIYGALFAVGWLLVYVYIYLARGPVTP